MVNIAPRQIRPYIVCCYVTNLDLTGDNLKKFLSVQTKLHKGVCQNRTHATIASHDREKIKGSLLNISVLVLYLYCFSRSPSVHCQASHRALYNTIDVF